MDSNELVQKVPARSSREIEEMANAALIHIFTYQQNAFLPYAFRTFFEEGGLARLNLGYGVEELVGEEAHYDAGTNEIILDVSTYDALCMDAPRAKFTLAHEIGHALLHGPYLRSEIGQGRTRHIRYPRKTLAPYEDPEWQANEFAGAFLMPANLMHKATRESCSDRQIAEYFGVSLQAAQIRRQKIKNRQFF